MIAGSAFNLSRNSTVFFLDETGQEHLADPRYPVFGLGGCAVRAEDYESHIRSPWRAMKAAHFGGPDEPLHASGLLRANPSASQLAAIGKFFERGQFYRVAAVMKAATTVDKALGPNYNAVSIALFARMRHVLERIQERTRIEVNRVGILLEDCERTRGLADRYMGNLGFDRDGVQIPIDRGRMEKRYGEPGLEVADFVLHAAGTHARHRAASDARPRRDFDAVFRCVREDLQSYIELDCLSVAPAP
jgi:hypothetical protein